MRWTAHNVPPQTQVYHAEEMAFIYNLVWADDVTYEYCLHEHIFGMCVNITHQAKKIVCSFTPPTGLIVINPIPDDESKHDEKSERSAERDKTTA